MRRHIGLWPAIGLMAITLLVGMIGGLALGGIGGYWYGSRSDSSTPAAAARKTSTATATATQTRPSTATSAQATQGSQSVDQIVARVNPAVVTVTNHAGLGTGTGTGMIIDEQGHIVTNNHVVEGANSLEVTYTDGKTVPATLVGADPYQDVAVIKVDPPVPGTITFGDSSKLQPGQQVIAIGSALGEFHNTITQGVVSANDRSLDTGDGFRLEHLVQHDAPINPGNSGGPLLNMQGEVVGMNTAIVQGSGFGQPSAQGLGFAIASNTVKSYAEQLIAKGQIEHPYLGISFRALDQTTDPTSNDRQAQPVLIGQVVPGSPADKAGLQAGDVITEVNGTALDDQHPFLNLMYEHDPGDTVTLTIQRDSGTQSVKVTLGTKPASTS